MPVKEEEDNHFLYVDWSSFPQCD